ncbi:MAG: c-type cytochrome [Acidobacteriota bacterium]|nr:c-type cytochrome [Acidobacteriota bacterium]
MGCAYGVGLLLTAQHGLGQPAGRPKLAGEAFKNIKVLQESPADSFNQSMHLITGALGVTCEYCHVEMGFDRDDVKKKDVARGMITMTAELNRKTFEGKQVITCYTCHQGHPIPQNTPPLPRPDNPAEAKSEAGLPPASEILAKYLNALGGEQNIRKIKTRIITAKQDVPTGPGGVKPMPAEVEIYQKAPGLLLRTAKTSKTTYLNGSDGTGAWTRDDRGRVAPLIALDAIREKRSADLYEPLNIAKDYANLKVEGIEKVGAADVYVLVGEPSEGVPVRLYFDTTSGLLLRRYTRVPTAVGDSPYQVDYDDYRDAGNGVKYPFKIHMEPAGPRTELDSHSTILIQRIRENEPIDDSMFIRPVSKEIPGPPRAAPQ